MAKLRIISRRSRYLAVMDSLSDDFDPCHDHIRRHPVYPPPYPYRLSSCFGTSEHGEAQLEPPCYRCQLHICRGAGLEDEVVGDEEVAHIAGLEADEVACCKDRMEWWLASLGELDVKVPRQNLALCPALVHHLRARDKRMMGESS
jgi:hypothetical protein